MFSRNHFLFFVKPDSYYHKWAEATFREECLITRTSASGVQYKVPGSHAEVHHRSMPSLGQLGLMGDAFRYSEEDVRVLHPEPLP
jgi:hypothetical protein